MKDYQEREIFTNNFVSIYWVGKEDWKLKTYFSYHKYKQLKMNGSSVYNVNQEAIKDNLDLVERFDMIKAVYGLNIDEIKKELKENV